MLKRANCPSNIHRIDFPLFSQSSFPKQGLLKHAKTDGTCQLIIMDKYSRQCQLTDPTHLFSEYWTFGLFEF